MSGYCGTVGTKITVTPPSGGNAALIALSSITNNLLTFAVSSLPTDVGVYSITVDVFFVTASTTVIKSDTATYTYRNPCT